MNPRAPLASADALENQVTEGFTIAAGGYDADGSEFFQQAGAWLVDTVGIPAGAWVLDVDCGKGAASLPAARAGGTAT